jgi:glucose dehydrogenase
MKIGGSCTWGWISYDPQRDSSNAGRHRTWNRSSVGRQQRVDDHLRAQSGYRHGEWVYQMTPHMRDYDVNEMILTDQRSAARRAT